MVEFWLDAWVGCLSHVDLAACKRHACFGKFFDHYDPGGRSAQRHVVQGYFVEFESAAKFRAWRTADLVTRAMLKV